MAKTSTQTEAIRQLIEAGGERFWHHQDLADYSSATVAKTLTQLVKEGTLQRLSKGHYYHPRPTRFGPSQPLLAELPYQLAKTPLYPAGVNASNLLGFTTQNALNGTFATTAKSLPAAWLGQRAKLYTRRPDTWGCYRIRVKTCKMGIKALSRLAFRNHFRLVWRSTKRTEAML